MRGHAVVSVWQVGFNREIKIGGFFDAIVAGMCPMPTNSDFSLAMNNFAPPTATRSL